MSNTNWLLPETKPHMSASTTYCHTSVPSNCMTYRSGSVSITKCCPAIQFKPIRDNDLPDVVFLNTGSENGPYKSICTGVSMSPSLMMIGLLANPDCAKIRGNVQGNRKLPGFKLKLSVNVCITGS